MRTSGNQRQVQLYHFRPPEFNRGGVSWYPLVCPRLLVLLDVARTIQGPIEISKNMGAVGRNKGQQDKSQHNIDFWNEVRAVDCFAFGVNTFLDAHDFVGVCTEIGFTGIGVYPEWTNNYGDKQVGFHLDTRRDREPGDPAKWGYVDGEFVTIETAIDAVVD